MQDLDSEIDIFALQGEEGIRKKLKEIEECEGADSLCKRLVKRLGRALGWPFLLRMIYLYCDWNGEQALEQVRRVVVMCEDQKCSNVELVGNSVQALHSHCSTIYILEPELVLMDNGHFMSKNFDEHASPVFVEFFLISSKKARKLYSGKRLEDDIFDQFFVFYDSNLPIDLLLLLLRYGGLMGNCLMTPERFIAMMLTNVVALVIHGEEHGDASWGDPRKLLTNIVALVSHGDVLWGDIRKLLELVDLVKKSFLVNSDLVRQMFEICIKNPKFLPFLLDFDLPNVDECFQILESRGLVNKKQFFQIPSLKQMCKVKIRGMLNQKWELPEGIEKLEGISQNLKCYLDLMTVMSDD